MFVDPGQRRFDMRDKTADGRTIARPFEIFAASITNGDVEPSKLVLNTLTGYMAFIGIADER